jgi:hypothetical protein
MFTYRDRTWCNEKTCTNTKCNRLLTDKEKAKATREWTGSPIYSLGELRDTELCIGYTTKEYNENNK